ncbi:MAG: hypothetical protein NTW86_00945 [Candidatus Sumerlaeota bacterium]|nr:hypothetical protein [Candidatus Sumerlaeota bacterium]
MNRVRFRKEQDLFVGPRQGNCVGLYSLAVDSARRRLYVAHTHTPNIAVLDADTGRCLKSIPLSKREYHFFAEVAFNPGAGALYVTSNYRDCMWIVDTRREKVVKTVQTGGHPAGVAVHEGSGRVYVAQGRDATVGVYDPNGEPIAAIPVAPWPYPIAVDSKNDRAYVVSQMDNLARFQNFEDPARMSNGVCSVIDTRRNRVIGRVEVGRRSRGVVCCPEFDTVFVSNRADDNLLAIDTSRGKVVATIETQCNPWGLDVCRDLGKLYVVNLLGEAYDNRGQPSTVSVIDCKQRRVLKHIPVGIISAWVAVDQERRLAYVANEDDASVSQIGCDEDVELGKWRGYGGTVDELTLNPKTGVVAVPAHFHRACLLLKPDEKRVQSVPLAGWVTGAAANPRTGKIYVNNAERGEVDVISERSGRRLKSVNLGVGCNLIHRVWGRVAIDSLRNRVYAVLLRYNGFAVIDGRTDRLIRRVVLGEQIKHDPGQFAGATEYTLNVHRRLNRIYAYHPPQQRVWVVDGDDYSILDEIDVRGLDVPLYTRDTPGYLRRAGAFHAACLDERANRLYVWAWAIDLETNKVVERLPRRLGFAVLRTDHQRDRIFTLSDRGIEVARLSDYEPLGRLPIHSTADRDGDILRVLCQVDAERGRAYVVRNIMLTGNRVGVYRIVG